MYAEYKTASRELYDLQNDPYELQSLQNDPAYAPVEAGAQDPPAQLENCAGATCRVYQPDPSP